MTSPSSKIRVIFMGTPDFACPSLETLALDSRFEILVVITQPDRKVGRKQEFLSSPIKNLALKHNLTIFQPEKLKNNAEFAILLQNIKPDFIVVVAYGQILDQTILRIPRFGCINIHGSLLPKYRGASPVEESLLQDDSETGVTIMEMDEKMDHGGIFLLKKITIEENDNALIIREKLSKLGAEFLPETLIDITQNDLQPIPQNHEKATYCQKITKEHGFIDLKEKTARQIQQMLKAYTPWPGCFLEIKGKKLKLIKIQRAPDKLLPAGIMKVDHQNVFIGTKEGVISLLEVQLEGKKPMQIEEFLRGNKNLFLS